MQTDVYCNEETVVRCCTCGQIAALKYRRFVKADALYEPGGKASPTGHYHCVCGKYIAYQQAKGRIVLSDPKYAEVVNPGQWARMVERMNLRQWILNLLHIANFFKQWRK